jgi:hypothetical protein
MKQLKQEGNIVDKINIVYQKISALKPYKNNAKKHNKEQVERIAESIKQFGFTQPVIVDQNNCVVAGHGRILGAKKAGLKEVPTVCLEDLTEEQIKAYRLIDNKLNESEWDWNLLDEELETLLDSEINMEMYGLTLEQLEDDLAEEKGETPFTEILNEENNYIVLKFENKVDWINAMGLLGIKKVKSYETKKGGNSKTFGDRAGVGRVIEGVKAIERLQGHES